MSDSFPVLLESATAPDRPDMPDPERRQHVSERLTAKAYQPPG